jgi:hypothetical protein
MYTKEYDQLYDMWEILDPEKIVIAAVKFESQANALLSHLNRG